MQLPPFKLERYFARYEFHVRHVLCASDCESVSVRELLAMEPEAEEKLLGLRLGYTESSGAPSLRRAIAGSYAGIEPDHVLVHAGAEEAIFLFLHALLRPGDHAIVHLPSYQSLAEVASSVPAEVTPWMARAENGWALDLDELRRLLRPETRLIVLNTPHNPTGWLMSRGSFCELAQLAEERGIVLFSDEVYRESEHDPVERLPAACELGKQAVSLGVMSKSYGLPGLRIGWVATRNAEVLARMAELKDYTTICNSGPSELLAEVGLRHRQTLATRNVGRILQNLDVLDGFFGRHADLFEWKRPKAGPIAFPRWLGGPVEAFCHELVTAAGVLLLPGPVYGDQGEHFRIGFGRADLPQAIDRLEGFMAGRARP